MDMCVYAYRNLYMQKHTWNKKGILQYLFHTTNNVWFRPQEFTSTCTLNNATYHCYCKSVAVKVIDGDRNIHFVRLQGRTFPFVAPSFVLLLRTERTLAFIALQGVQKGRSSRNALFCLIMQGVVVLSQRVSGQPISPGPLKMGPISCPETSVRNYH